MREELHELVTSTMKETKYPVGMIRNRLATAISINTERWVLGVHD
jgi:hypothetical protein